MSHPPDRHPPVVAGTQIATTEPPVTRLTPIGDPMMLLEAQKHIVATIEKILTPGVDYAVVPGTDGKKPSLMKAGAERVLFAFDIRPEFTLISEDVDHDRVVKWRKRKKVWRNAHRGDKKFDWTVEDGESLGVYRYVVRCQLVRRSDGMIVGEGVGVCSTLEAKYVDRPRETENTVLKMAKKRALVDATLTGFALSERFTQDVEEAVEAEPEPERRPEPEAAPVQAPRARRERQPDDWTDADREAIVSLARRLRYDGAALRRVIQGVLGHYPPKAGEDVAVIRDTLETEIAAMQASEAEAAASEPTPAAPADTTAPTQ